MAEKSRGGFTREVKELLAQFGATKLSEIKEEDYEELLLEAQAIGTEA